MVIPRRVRSLIMMTGVIRHQLTKGYKWLSMLKLFHIHMSWYSVGLTSHIPMTATATAGAVTSVPDMAEAGAEPPTVDGRHRLTITQDRHRGHAALRGRGSTTLIRRFGRYREDGRSRVIAWGQQRQAAIRRALGWSAPCHLPRHRVIRTIRVTRVHQGSGAGTASRGLPNHGQTVYQADTGRWQHGL